ncbi:MAG: alpha/beta fold hydrolase [Thermoflexaceae bacterium]|nr:alpha/beta fold hydrolase [Thermoflexaceae bacterium]
MAERVELIYKSRDGITQIHATEWLPEERPPKAVLQIVHGMKEYVDRYDGFARYIADRGFIVVGEDHLGHGRTAITSKDLGYFAKKDSDIVLVKDVHRLKKTIQAEYPGLPYFLYGFSMGSFIARKYLTMYGEGIDGAIIGGTGWQPERGLDFGIFVTSFLTKIHGDRYRSDMVEKMSLGSYNARISNPRTASDWICSVDSVVDKYVADSKCTFKFTVNAYNTLYKLIKYVQEPRNIKRIPENLPVIFMSGLQDPVGDYGEGVKKAAELYLVNGMKNVSIKLYDGMRHEIHNETRKHIVYLDMLEWLESLL